MTQPVMEMNSPTPTATPDGGKWTMWLMMAALAISYLWRGGAVPGSRTAILLAVAAAVYAWYRESRLTVAIRPGWLGRTIFWPGITALLAVLWSVRPAESLQAALVWLALGAVFWVALAAGASSPERLVRAHINLAAFTAGLALALYVLIPLYPRTRGTLDYPNAMGLLMLVTLLLFWGYMDLDRRPRAGQVALGMLLATTLWLSMSRGILYLLPLVVLLSLGLAPAGRRARGAAFLLTVLGLGYGGAWLMGWLRALAPVPDAWLWTDFGRTLERMSISAADYSLAGRLELWAAGWRMFLTRPWGWGPATFGSVYPAFQAPDSILFSTTPHSLYMQALVEQGALGLAALAGVGLSTVALLMRGLAGLTARSRMQVAAVAGALAAMAIHGVYDLTWDIPAVGLTAALMLAVLAATVRPGATAAGPARWVLPGLALVVLVGIARPLAAGNEIRTGDRHLAAANLPAARAAFTRAAALDPWSSIPLAGRAAARFEAWDHRDATALSDALGDLDLALRRDRYNPGLYEQKAAYLAAKGDVRGARATLQDGLAVARQSLSLRVRLAALELSQGETATARSRLEGVLADLVRVSNQFTRDYLNDWSANAHVLLAQLDMADAHWPDAADHLTQALAAVPDHRPAHLLMEQVGRELSP